jgi:voltage-gated potassium channel
MASDMPTGRKTAYRKWREFTHEMVFIGLSRAGKTFDIVVVLAIILSVIVVMVDSVRGIAKPYSDALFAAEWFFTIAFSLEFAMRMWCTDRRYWYAKSFFGMVDLLAILPSYVSLFIPGTQYLLVIRVLRLLRIFRILKLVKYISEAHLLREALRAARRKITIFLCAVIFLTFILGSLMYVIEGEQSGFTSIPRGVYWAIVTLTTVGYGDISPMTSAGQALAAIVMIMGYAIIAVPTGIVSVELSQAMHRKTKHFCRVCEAEEHDEDANYCKHCGASLELNAL